MVYSSGAFASSPSKRRKFSNIIRHNRAIPLFFQRNRPYFGASVGGSPRPFYNQMPTTEWASFAEYPLRLPPSPTRPGA